jgi:hypothetical protein
LPQTRGMDREPALIDVLYSKPPLLDNPLLHARNCTVTPHIAWATKEARTRLVKTVVLNLRVFLEGHPVNVVNEADTSYIAYPSEWLTNRWTAKARRLEGGSCCARF